MLAAFRADSDVHPCVMQEIDRRRHLMRLWVAPPNERPLPDEYIELWGSTRPGHRGGIFIGGTPLTVPLEAE